MGRIDIDVTAAGKMPEGNYSATVVKIEYQVLTGEKWNNEGTTTVDFDSWVAARNTDKRVRAHITLNVPGKGNIWHDLYIKEGALGFVRQFLTACQVHFGKEGFDFDLCIGKQVGITIVIKEDEYGVDSKISKLYKV